MESAADQALRRSIYSLERKREKYRRVSQSISANQLNYKRDLGSLQQYIDHCKSLIAVIDSDSGYAYLATLRDKLQDDAKVLQEYHDYCRDANDSFQVLYNHLINNIDIMGSTISSQKAAYNDGKPFWEWIW